LHEILKRTLRIQDTMDHANINAKWNGRGYARKSQISIRRILQLHDAHQQSGEEEVDWYYIMSIVGSFGLLGWIPLFIEALLLVQGGC
jgi:hypothetical protein